MSGNSITELLKSASCAREILKAVDTAVESLGKVDRRVSKSQVGYYRAHAFASVWVPAQFLKNARPPLVLSVFLDRKDRSHRWKEVVEPKPGRFTHHLEILRPSDIDKQVRDWLAEAWRLAD